MKESRSDKKVFGEQRSGEGASGLKKSDVHLCRDEKNHKIIRLNKKRGKRKNDRRAGGELGKACKRKGPSLK